MNFLCTYKSSINNIRPFIIVYIFLNYPTLQMKLEASGYLGASLMVDEKVL